MKWYYKLLLFLFATLGYFLAFAMWAMWTITEQNRGY